MKKVLYVVDDINYNSGAKAVTLLQMNSLRDDYDIYLLSLAQPKEKINFLDEQHILDKDIWQITEIYAESFRIALKSNRYSVRQKLSRIFYAFSLRIGAGSRYFESLIKNKLKPVLETFDAVIVVSEASKLREIVAELEHPKKIQWIHTDYARWSEFSEWSKAVTRNDRSIYGKYDEIVVLSEFCKDGLLNKLPSIAGKVHVISNLVDGNKILELANEPDVVSMDGDYLNLVTVARIDHEKRIEKVLDLALELKRRNIQFKWYVIGDGPERESLEEKKKKMGLDESVIFMGYMSNPYPIMAKCNALVLLSKYEGTPVTIDEAMVLGIGVIAPDIGGISEQLRHYEAKYLIDPENLQESVDGVLQRFARVQMDFNTFNKDNLERIKKVIG